MVVVAAGGSIGAVNNQRLIGFRFDEDHAFHRNAGLGVELTHIALHPPDRRILEQKHPKIDEVAEVMPQNVVGPASLISGRAHIDEALDEEAPRNMPDVL